jgi:hypothetical protein
MSQDYEKVQEIIEKFHSSCLQQSKYEIDNFLE